MVFHGLRFVLPSLLEQQRGQIVVVTSATGSVSAFLASVLSGGSANVITNASFARGYFLGDYQGLTASGNHFVSFYVNPNTTGPNDTDVFAAIS